MAFYKGDKYFSVINGVQIIQGRIVDNPFSYTQRRTQAVQWLLLKEQLVKRNLSKLMQKVDYKGYSVDDCFNYALDYFMRKDKTFLVSYSHDNDYNVAKYVMGNLKYVVTEFVRDNDKSLPAEFSIPTGDSDLESIKGRFVSESAFTDITETLDNKVVDVEHLDDLLQRAFELFSHFIQNNKYSDFDTKKFLYLMFIEPKYSSVDKQAKFVSSELSIHKELVRLVIDDIQESYLSKDRHTVELFETLKKIQDMKKD